MHISMGKHGNVYISTIFFALTVFPLRIHIMREQGKKVQHLSIFSKSIGLGWQELCTHHCVSTSSGPPIYNTSYLYQFWIMHIENRSEFWFMSRQYRFSIIPLGVRYMLLLKIAATRHSNFICIQIDLHTRGQNRLTSSAKGHTLFSWIKQA